jgi:hypothetical protein
MSIYNTMLNFDKIGKPLCKIVGNSRLKGKTIYVDANDEVEDCEDEVKTFSCFEIKNNDKLQLIPDNSERQVIYICGSSGSGKSTFASNYIKEYKKKYKDNDVYIISNVDEDECVDSIPDVKRVVIDEGLHEEPLDKNEFQNCLVLFDDDASISNKKIKQAILNLKNELLETGRHLKCSVICISHMATAGNETKKILNESHIFVWFPANFNRNLNYMLESYCGLDKKQVKAIRDEKTRWCCIFKNFPQTCMLERKIYLLNQKEDDHEKDKNMYVLHPPSAYKKKGN